MGLRGATSGSERRARWTGAGGVVVLVGLLLLGPLPAVAAITYVYDELGRLRAVIDPAQPDGVGIYTYDAVGNILSVTRQPVSQVAIIEFFPKRGPVGTTVTIQGAGYSPTPAENAVTLNGVAAAVSSATTTELIVTVPAGATTGPLAVTAPGGSATSGEPFTVTADSGAPTITGLAPGIGLGGTAVTVSGTNFEPTAANNRLALNVTRAAVTSATATTLATAVPPKATSGRFAIATPGGSGVSPGYFFVPPAPYTPADVLVTDSMAIGGTKTVTIGTANKVALVVFDGTAGQRISVQMTGVTIAYSTVKVYTPAGAQLGPDAGVNTGGGFSDVQTLPASGTYQILVDPANLYTGSLTLTLYNVPPDQTGPITPGGASVGVSFTVPGQNARLTFAGTAGQRVSAVYTNASVSSSYAYLEKPDGTILGVGTPIYASATPSGFMDATTLPVSGTYTLRIDPNGTAIGSMTVTLYDVVDLTGTISPGGAPVTVSVTTPGQNGVYSFPGTAGQRVSLTVGSIAPSPAGLWVTIRKPDGTNQTSPAFMGSAGAFIEPTTLATSGTYTILVDPTPAWTGSVTLTLFDVPADGTGTITPGGAAVPVTITTAGQNARLTFSGTASQRVSLRMTAVTIPTSNVSLLKPDGTTLATAFGVGTGGGFLDTQTLPTTGTYTVFVDPQGSGTGSMTLTLYDVVDVTGTLTINGGGLGVTIGTPGQNAVLTFAGTASQPVTVRITGNAIGSISVSLLKPDGSALTSGASGNASWNLATQTLPTTGTYTVTVDPWTTNTGAVTVSVTSP